MPNPCDIFISYRRSDAAGHARALHRDLCRRFGSERLFFDRESIESGDVFPERLRDSVCACKVLLALIGPEWLEAKDSAGNRRLDNPEDFVRIEIALALEQGHRVIPVLFEDITIPDATRLPEPLKRLAACDALLLRGKNFARHVLKKFGFEHRDSWKTKPPNAAQSGDDVYVLDLHRPNPNLNTLRLVASQGRLRQIEHQRRNPT